MVHSQVSAPWFPRELRHDWQIFLWLWHGGPELVSELAVRIWQLWGWHLQMHRPVATSNSAESSLAPVGWTWMKHYNFSIFFRMIPWNAMEHDKQMMKYEYHLYIYLYLIAMSCLLWSSHSGSTWHLWNQQEAGWTLSAVAASRSLLMAAWQCVCPNYQTVSILRNENIHFLSLSSKKHLVRRKLGPPIHEVHHVYLSYWDAAAGIAISPRRQGPLKARRYLDFPPAGGSQTPFHDMEQKELELLRRLGRLGTKEGKWRMKYGKIRDTERNWKKGQWRNYYILIALK